MLREYFEIVPDINDKRLTPCVGAASRRLKGWVGTEAYADALSSTPTDASRKADLELAEAQLAMHFAVPGLNTKITPGGVVKSERADNAGTVLSFLTPTEVRQLAQIYLDQAEETARPYLLSDGTPEAEFAVVTE
jgi:hypothetical protein